MTIYEFFNLTIGRTNDDRFSLYRRHEKIFTCTSGQISIGILGEVYELKKGDVLAFPGDKPHSYKNSGKSEASGVSVVFFSTGQ